MKKLFKSFVPLLALLLLVATLSSCGKVAGSTYRQDKEPKNTIVFNTNGTYTAKYDDWDFSGTYKIKGKEIFLNVIGVKPSFTIGNIKRTKLKDHEGNIWTKI